MAAPPSPPGRAPVPEPMKAIHSTTPKGLPFTHAASAFQKTVAISFAFKGGFAHDAVAGSEVSLIRPAALFEGSFGGSQGDIAEQHKERPSRRIGDLTQRRCHLLAQVADRTREPCKVRTTLIHSSAPPCSAR